MNKLQELQERKKLRDSIDVIDLIEAVAKHRTDRYGDPPTPPFFSVDTELYKKAGIV